MKSYKVIFINGSDNKNKQFWEPCFTGTQSECEDVAFEKNCLLEENCDLSGAYHVFPIKK